jgi:hypothetical protein
MGISCVPHTNRFGDFRSTFSHTKSVSVQMPSAGDISSFQQPRTAYSAGFLRPQLGWQWPKFPSRDASRDGMDF